MVDETPSHAVDAVTRDAVEAQKRQGILPRVHSVRSYIQGVVERMDRKEADRRPAPAVKPPPRHVQPRTDESALEKEYRTRLARKGMEALPGKWTIERRPASKIVSPRVLRSKGAQLLGKRIALIRRNPEWAAKMKDLNLFLLDGRGGMVKAEAVARKAMELIEDSTRVFGDWRKEPEKRLFFDKAGA